MPRVACVQMDVKYADREGNTQRIIDSIHALRAQGVDIAVFPECSIGGYCVAERAACQNIAIDRSSPLLGQIQSAADETDMIVILGFAESAGDEYRNTAAILTPHEEARFYVKTHLPELGYDHFVQPGDELPVFETKFGKIGVLICFDVRFPEAARILALEGALAIFLPTNWPKGADISSDVLALARAAENKVYVATCNRVGTENGFEFIGKSKIIDPMGRVLQGAGNEEAVLLADMDFTVSQDKRNVTIPGKHETTVFESRRPELYAHLLSHTVQIAGKNAVK